MLFPSVIDSPPIYIYWQFHYIGFYWKIQYVLQNHKQCSTGDEDASQNGAEGELLMKQYGCQEDGDHDAEFIDGDDLRYISDLQRLIIAQPGCAGCQTGKDQKQPASPGDLIDAMMAIG